MDINAKGLALFASGYIVRGNLERAKALLEKVASLRCHGYDGHCWGYNFDWQARAFYVRKGTPNLVTTVFVANAFLDYYDASGDEWFLSLADGACQFLLGHMILHENDSVMYFRYIPGEDAIVHNAYMLGAALLGRVYRLTHESRYLEASTKAMRNAVSAQKPDGSWPYGERSHHQFIDNFHTGYNLVSLYRWMRDVDDHHWKAKLKSGYEYWLRTFFLPNGCPKYYNDRLYPVDIHCSAQGIVTCLELQSLDERSVDMAETIATWAIQNMQHCDGYFYFQKTRWYMNRIPYIRWSQAWMFYALSMLLQRRAR
jgi:hypothetical protein